MKHLLLLFLISPFCMFAQSPALDTLSRFLLLKNGKLIKGDLYKESNGHFQQEFTYATGESVPFEQVRLFKNRKGVHIVINPALRRGGVFKDYATRVIGGKCSIYDNRASQVSGSSASSRLYNIDHGSLQLFKYENLKIDLVPKASGTRAFKANKVQKLLEKGHKWETKGDGGGKFLGIVSVVGGLVIIAANAEYNSDTDSLIYKSGALVGLGSGLVGLLTLSASSTSSVKANKAYLEAVRSYNALFR